MFKIQHGVPLPPEARGRMKGSVDRNHLARQAAIAKGVILVESGLNYTDAAKVALFDYPITQERMARLISQSIKDSNQRHT